MMEKMIRVKWVKSAIGKPAYQKETLKGLGFRRLNQTLTVVDRPEIRGMVHRVNHLLEVTE
jgi:large subunit ribosomal protein L30